MRKRILFATMLVAMMSLQGCSCSKSDAPVVIPVITTEVPNATPVVETTTSPVAETTATPVVDVEVEITEAPVVETITATPEVTEATEAPEITEAPEVTEVQEAEATATPAPVVKPTATPAPEVKATPKPTEAPEVKATATPKPTEAPAPTLAPYQDPYNVKPSNVLEFERNEWNAKYSEPKAPAKDSVLGWSLANADLPIETGRYYNEECYREDNCSYWKSKGVFMHDWFDYFFDVDGKMVLPPTAKVNEEDNTVWSDYIEAWMPICSAYELDDVIKEISEWQLHESCMDSLDTFGLEINQTYLEMIEEPTSHEIYGAVIWKRGNRDYVVCNVSTNGRSDLRILEANIPEYVYSDDELYHCIEQAILEGDDIRIDDVK